MTSQNLDRKSLLFLAAILVFSLMLHMDRLPLWILTGAVLSVVWRYLIYLAKLSSPHWSLKGGLVLAGFSGIYLTFGRELSIESMVALLVAGLALKPLEVEKTKDSYVLIFLCYLLIGLHFLFERDPLDYIFVMLILVLILAAQVVVNQSHANIENQEASLARGAKPFWLALSIFLKSLPLAIFLFVVLPRLAPLWSMTTPTQSGITGLSDSMSPGQIAELGKSDELAFRVRFTSDVPPMGQRYWRALILDYFDGERWSEKFTPKVDWSPYDFIPEKKETDVEYQVMLQPHDKKWLFSLGSSLPLTSGIGIQEDGRLISKRVIHGQFQYDVRSALNAPFQKQGLSKRALKHYLQLPDNENPQSLAFAKKLKVKYPNIKDFIIALKYHFNSNEFFYTLNPGILSSSDSIDEFLFKSRRGFCAHYAGSVTYMLRQVGIPSRVVLGYLGGEPNSVAGYYSVYQYDAHAWLEFWLQGQGWIRLDPTGWISPERIEEGMEQAVKKEFVGFSSNYSWLRPFRDRLNAMSYYWNDWMLNYKDNTQKAFISNLFGKRSSDEMTFIFIICSFSLVGFVFLFLLLDFKPLKLSFSQKLFLLYKSNLEKSGLQFQNGVSFSEMSQQAISSNPPLKNEIMGILRHFESCLYSKQNSELSKKDYRYLRKAIKELSRKL